MANDNSLQRAFCFLGFILSLVVLFWSAALILVLANNTTCFGPLNLPKISEGMTDVVIKFIGLVVSITAAFLVIWGPYWRLRLAGPKLRLQLVHPKGQLVHHSVPHRYYHVLVSNERPSYAAEECKVMLVNAAKKNAAGAVRQRGFAAPLQLSWPYPDLPGHNPLQKIGPQLLCDLGSLSAARKFTLATYARTDVFDLQLEENETMQIELVATSLAGISKPLFIEIRWAGNWIEGTEDMASDLVIREVADLGELFLTR